LNAAQQLLRATNLEIRRVSEDVNSDNDEFLCECGRKDCQELIRLTNEQFDTFCAMADGTPLIAPPHR
jgi:hypothetical protein